MRNEVKQWQEADDRTQDKAIAVMQSPGLSKQQEIESYRNFVRDQRAGTYLASILHGSDDYVEQQIRNDFALPMAGELRATQAQALEAADQLKAVRKQLEDARAELKALERKIVTATNGLAEIATLARNVARIV
jgi:hypothetical protein